MYKSWFVSREEPWIAYCKFFDMIRTCVVCSKIEGVPIEIIFAGESRTRLKRFDISKDYKANRKPSLNLEFREYRKNLVYLLEKLGWPLISVPGAEADDVIASFVKKYCYRCTCATKCENCICADKYTTDVVIFSGDKDLQQLLNWSRVKIYLGPRYFVTREKFEKTYGIDVEDFYIYKALVGDKSDNIKGVIGFGPAKAKTSILNGTVAEDIWEMGGEEAFNDFKTSLALIKLDYNCDISGKEFVNKHDISEIEFIDKRILFEVKKLLLELN